MTTAVAGGALRLPDHRARESVIQSFQATAWRTNPGTEAHEQADQAALLALNARRRSSGPVPYLLNNLLRDALRVLRRRARREVFFSLLEAAAEAGSPPGATPKALDDLLPPSREPTPADQASAADLESKLRAAVTAIPYGMACLDGMLAGEKPSATAARLGVPAHRIDQTRKAIRDQARAVLR